MDQRKYQGGPFFLYKCQIKKKPYSYIFNVIIILFYLLYYVLPLLLIKNIYNG